jgi:aryl-alcohol dehydrogenase-like predicted oxidoreductase
MSRDGVTAPIASATSLEQLESLIGSTRLVLTSGEIAALDQASA